MTVDPGFGGRSDIAAMEQEVAEPREPIDRTGLPVQIEVAGAVPSP